MALLKDADKAAVKKELAGLSGPVKIVNFTQQFECDYCKETNEILKEVAALSDKTSVETYDFMTDKEVADELKIDKITATIIMGKEDYGIRFYRIPSGYEFISLLESIKMVSAGQSGLSQKIKDILHGLKGPVRLQVLVTPT